MTEPAQSPLPVDPTAAASARPKETAGARLTKWLYRIAALLFLIVSAARLYAFFFPSLPDCDDSVTRSTLSDIFKRDKLEPTAYDATRTLTKSKDELTCSASLEMKDGSIMEIAYRIFWKGKEVFVEITQKAFNREHK